MAELSPAAQAVADAYDNTPELPTGNHCYHWLAAAIRAVADQVKCRDSTGPRDQWEQGFFAAISSTQEELLAIAAELEGGE